MTELSREILRDWQIRKTKAQKLRFIEFLQSRLPGLAVEEGGWPRCRNLVLGDPENADVIFTAHYDTCARLPFPNFVTPNNLLIYLLYQFLILLPFFAAAGLLIPPRAYNALRAGFKRLPWVVIFVVFLLAVQLVIQLRSGDIQPFIYYQF